MIDDDFPDESDAPIRISFFAPGRDSDPAVCEMVWAIFSRDSTERGFDCRSRASIAASKALAKRRAAGGDEPGKRWRHIEMMRAKKKAKTVKVAS